MLPTINWRPNSRQMRSFGAVFLVGFAILGGLLLWRGKPGAAHAAWILGGAVGGLALLAPPLARPFYLAWMGLAFVMGTVMSAVILTLIFYLVVTPIGLAMRLAGRDALALRKKAGQTTYWVEHPALTDKTYYERLF